jgi:hypothetical protein
VYGGNFIVCWEDSFQIIKDSGCAVLSLASSEPVNQLRNWSSQLGQDNFNVSAAILIDKFDNFLFDNAFRGHNG